MNQATSTTDNGTAAQRSPSETPPNLVQNDDDRRSRRRQRRRQQQLAHALESSHQYNVQISVNPSSAPHVTTATKETKPNQPTVTQATFNNSPPPTTNDHYKSEVTYVMSGQDIPRRRHTPDTRTASMSRSPPDVKRIQSLIRPVTVSAAQALIPSTWQDPPPSERQRKRSTGGMTPTRITSPLSPQRDKRHSLNSPTIPITAGSHFLMLHPPSELRVHVSPPGGTRAAIHIIEDFLQNPPPRQRSLSRGGSRGSRKGREEKPKGVSKPPCTVGLDHLDNLCRLMEQLSSLREENVKLRKRCAFLQNTRDLFKIQNEMLLQERGEYESEDDTLSLGLSESTLAESQILDDDDVFSHSTTTASSHSMVRTTHSTQRRSQSVGSLELGDVFPLPLVVKQQSVPYHAPFTSKFKKSFKITRNTIKKVFSTKKDGVEYSIVKSPVPTISTPVTPQEERLMKLSQSSEHSSPSPCPSEHSTIGKDTEAEELTTPEPVTSSKSEMSLQLDPPVCTREVVSDDACSRPSPAQQRRRYKRPQPDSQILTRRKSSPTLTTTKDDIVTNYKRPTTPDMPRSATSSDFSPKDDKIRGKTAWGKVKDIIHTRKDSLKKRSHRKMDENRRSMTEAMLERKSAEPGLSGVPKLAEQDLKVSSSSDTKLNEMGMSGTGSERPIVTSSETKSSPVMPVNADTQKAKALKELVGNLTEEFNRKMMEWERKKSDKKPNKTSERAGSVGERLSELGLDSSVKCKPHRKISHATGYPHSLSKSGDNVTTSALPPTPVTLESLQKGMTDSFNRKMLEWERMRSGQGQDGYMSVEGIRRDAPWKSRSEKKTKAEKEKLRQERLREKELVKVDRERQKLERDRQRLQREQQRTMRRAVELERKKEQLEEHGLAVESGREGKGHIPLSHHQSFVYDDQKHRYKFVNVGEYQIEGVTHQFAKRLQTWEEKRHKTRDAWDPQEKDRQKQLNEVGDIVIPPKFKEGQPPLPIVIRSNLGMPEHLEQISHSSPQIVRVEPTYQRATLCTHETQTSPQSTAGKKGQKRFQFDDPITDLRHHNVYLSEALHQKESESQSLQDDVEGLNRALRRMNESYTKEIASYKHQLWASSHWGQMSEQSRFVAKAVQELRNRVDQLEDMHCMDVRRRPFSGEKSDTKNSSTPTVDISQTGKYKNLIDYVKKLQSQITDLKKGVVERDDVLNKFQKHLSLEETNKLLLNADIQRRDLELQFFKKKHKHGVIRRHCTFGGQDFCIRQGCDEKKAFKTWPKYRARCVDKIPSTFRHGNFEEASIETDSDIADVLRSCGINSEEASNAADNQQDIINGNTTAAVSPAQRQYPLRRIPTRSIGTQFGFDVSDYRYSSRQDVVDWSPEYGHQYHYQTIPGNRRTDDLRAEDRGSRSGDGGDLSPRHESQGGSDSDSERRSRIDYGRHNLREQFFSSVTDTPRTRSATVSPRPHSTRSNDGSLSPSYRSTKSPVSDDGRGEGGVKTSFKVRSATYFSPKPYSKAGYPDDLPRIQLPEMEMVRRLGPLRKLHSASELMSERRAVIAGRYAHTEVRHTSLMERKAREDYFMDISLRRSQLLQQQEMATSQSNIHSSIDVPSMAQVFDQPQDSDITQGSVPTKELPQEGTVRRLTEVFVSGIDITNGSRPKYIQEHVSAAMQRKMSMEIPKEGTVQKRLEEFVPNRKSESPPQRKRASEIPKEGTVQKRLEELKSFDSDRQGPDGKESRRSDSDDSQIPPGRKDTISSTDSAEFGCKSNSDDDAFDHLGTKTSHTSIRLRPQPIGQQYNRDRTSKRLSPMEMLVRGTVSLNLDVVSPGYGDRDDPDHGHQSHDDPPLSPAGSDRSKRRSWFARSFFKSQK